MISKNDGDDGESLFHDGDDGDKLISGRGQAHFMIVRSSFMVG